MIRWLKRVDRTAREVYAMFRHEMANPSMIGPHSPRLWRRGFILCRITSTISLVTPWMTTFLIGYELVTEHESTGPSAT